MHEAGRCVQRLHPRGSPSISGRQRLSKAADILAERLIVSGIVANDYLLGVNRNLRNPDTSRRARGSTAFRLNSSAAMGCGTGQRPAGYSSTIRSWPICRSSAASRRAAVQ